jgi:hypothetical protein
MRPVARRRVTVELLTVTQCETKSSFVTIPEGSIIETTNELQEPGLCVVNFDGKELLAFTRDLREKTEKLSMNANLA